MFPFAYLLSPLLGLGVSLHMLQDSFTTAKDRGVEWFYPLTKLVRRGLNDPAGNPTPRNPREQIYFNQEDPKYLINSADPDLREVGPDPVPWRRVYGFAQNKHILDRGFLFGSAAVEILRNVESIFSDPVPVVSTAAAVGIAVLLTVAWQVWNDKRNNRRTIVRHSDSI